jgi:putative membrane protein
MPANWTRLAALALGAIALGTAIGAWVGFGEKFSLIDARFYNWIKAFHIIAVIAWMAGMLYLPRLFVYHSDAAPGSVPSETFKVMERRLLRVIITPAMAMVWVLGLWLFWRGGWHVAGWMHAKFALAIALTGLHGYLSAATRAFAEDRNSRTSRHWRLVNEVPTVLMIGIVILVVVKPF